MKIKGYYSVVQRPNLQVIYRQLSIVNLEFIRNIKVEGDLVSFDELIPSFESTAFGTIRHEEWEPRSGFKTEKAANKEYNKIIKSRIDYHKDCIKELKKDIKNDI
jgi:hypothetical protein